MYINYNIYSKFFRLYLMWLKWYKNYSILFFEEVNEQVLFKYVSEYAKSPDLLW